MDNAHPLHHCYVHKRWGFLNRTWSFVHMLALSAMFYYRGAYLLKVDNEYRIPCFLIFMAELVVSFIWALKQPVYWRPVTRTVFPEKLPKDEELPGIDVFICTADPNKEPTFDVMNTVLSAMALDYPADKLNIYLSDDGGASVTLDGMKEAWVFATWWLPFCRRYNIKPICPQAYFQKPEGEISSKNFIEDRMMVQEKFSVFKQQVRNRRARGEHTDDVKMSQDHPAVIQIIDSSCVGDAAGIVNPEHVEIPFLVYIAREKRPQNPHNFKAGALNVLLRVSSILSNSPYILVLDCDMYCNDSMSARQAMCFYFDSEFSPSLGWVQYPQKFHNVNENDIYDSQFRIVWPVYWPGADGYQGPWITGTNFYIKRKAIYGIDINNGNGLQELKDSLGASNALIKSVRGNDKPNVINNRDLSSILRKEAHFLASCIYERDTKWGEKVGFQYNTVVEDVMTGLFLESKGWRSVYLNPPRPQFLGSATINLNDVLIQGIRWYSGFADVLLSKYFPLIHSPSKIQFLQKMFFSFILCEPLYFLPILCFGTILPICFLYGIPLYPKVSDPFFFAFAFACISSLLKHLCDVLISGGSASAWLVEQRIWMIKSVTCYFYATVECFITKLGLHKANFIPTNKAGDGNTSRLYNLGKYDFRTSNMFLIPLVTAVTLNTFSFVGGVARLIAARDCDRMSAQLFLSMYVLIVSLPVIEGMLLRKDNGRVPSSTTLISAMISVGLLSLGHLILLH